MYRTEESKQAFGRASSVPLAISAEGLNPLMILELSPVYLNEPDGIDGNNEKAECDLFVKQLHGGRSIWSSRTSHRFLPFGVRRRDSGFQVGFRRTRIAYEISTAFRGDR